MKKSKNDDSAAKAFQERYARILGLDQFSASETPKKSSLRWPMFFLMLLGLAAIGVWFFFRPPSVGTTPSAALTPSTDSQQSPVGSAGPGLPGKSDAGQWQPVAPEQPDPNGFVGGSAPRDRSNDSQSTKNQHSLPESPSSDSAGSAPEPAASGASLVVLWSTRSKDEAIERARELSNGGNPSEVILSSSGYYGVVLRRDTYEEAQAAMKAIAASGVVKTAPYIMSASRVKEHIYPGVQ
jgi:hypothetical protein